jgi:hypothetical protein
MSFLLQQQQQQQPEPAEQEAERAHAHAVLCYCGRNAVRACVKKYGPTQGQFFWTCATPWREPARCTFFRWFDESEGKRLSFKGHRVASRHRNRFHPNA